MNIVLVTLGLRRAPTWQERIVAFLVRWAILTLAVWIAAAIVPGIVLDGWKSAIVVGLILGFLNAILKPILFFISLPITVLTLGLFLLIINTALLALTAWIAGQIDGISFDIDDFWAAFLGALIISLVSWILGWFVNADKVARNVAR
jgi:putative membrane protein